MWDLRPEKNELDVKSMMGVRRRGFPNSRQWFKLWTKRKAKPTRRPELGGD